MWGKDPQGDRKMEVQGGETLGHRRKDRRRGASVDGFLGQLVVHLDLGLLRPRSLESY